MDLNTRLSDLIDYKEEHLYKGFMCPCCDQFAKAYRRRLGSTMSVALIYLSKVKGDEYVFLKDYFAKFNIKKQLYSNLIGSDVPKLRFWGLIEPMKATREDGSNRSGYYRITEYGRKFVYGAALAHEYAVTYNNQIIRLDGDMITIGQSLKNKFNYNELMRDGDS